LIHSSLLVVAAYLAVLGIVICAFLVAVTIKGRKGIWLITLPGIFIVAVLGVDFVCHMMHLPRHVIPYQKQIVNAIHWTLDVVMVPLVLIKLRELWLKRLARVATGELQ